MMPPVLLLARFGRPCRFTLPLPLFLLWPLLLLVWIVLGLAWLVTSGGARPRSVQAGITALRVINELHGTRIDVRGSDGSFYLRFI